MIGKMDTDRFKTIFSRILNKRIVPFVEEHVLEILDNKNFNLNFNENIAYNINIVYNSIKEERGLIS